MNNSHVAQPERDRALFLDGIRGWASLMVLFSHLICLVLANSIPFFQGWIFGIATDGNFAIFIFFVLSGFVLSIGYVQTGNLEILTALAMRRYVRLAIPIFFTSIFAYLLLKFGFFYNVEAGHLFNNAWLAGFYTRPPDLLSYMEFALYGVFTSTDFSYNSVLWTMPIELWGSFMVFSICALVLHLKRRIIILGVILLYLFAANEIYYLPFVCGICIAIFHAQPDARFAKYLRYMSPILLGLVIYYSCSTDRGGIFGLPAMHRSDMLNTLGACIIVMVASCTTLVKNFFENALSRYLGSISFPLYLTHLLILCSFSSFMMIKLQDLGFSPGKNRAINLIASIAVCIFVAHLFRHIELFAIRTARRFSSWMLFLEMDRSEKLGLNVKQVFETTNSDQAAM